RLPAAGTGWYHLVVGPGPAGRRRAAGLRPGAGGEGGPPPLWLLRAGGVNHGLAGARAESAVGRLYHGAAVPVRPAPGVLAGRGPAALEVPGRGGGVAAPGAAAHGAGLLPPARPRPEQPPGTRVRGADRRAPAVLVPGSGG